MATWTPFNSFLEALAEKKHDLSSDQIAVALTNTAPNATDETLSDITEISYTNLSSRNVTTSSSAQSNGTYKLVLADLELTATGAVGPFRYAVLYNDDAANDELIGYMDYGSSITMANGDKFKLDFDGTNGLFTLALKAS